MSHTTINNAFTLPVKHGFIMCTSDIVGDPFYILGKCLGRPVSISNRSRIYSGCGIYLLFSLDECVYIGMSRSNMRRRVSNHISAHGDLITGIIWIETDDIGPSKTLEYEQRFIKDINPRLNIMCNPVAPWPSTERRKRMKGDTNG